MNRPPATIGVIGDVHAEDDLLADAINRLRNRAPDLIVCVGDIADGKGDIDRCIRLLRQFEIPTVCGNHDRWLLTGTNRGVPDASFPENVSDDFYHCLESLPATIEFPIAGGQLLLCHGLGEYDLASVRPTDSLDEIYNNLELWALYRRPDLRVVINGHTHRKEVRQFGHLTIISAGTLHRNEDPCCAFVDLPARRIDFIELTDVGSDRRDYSITWPENS